MKAIKKIAFRHLYVKAIHQVLQTAYSMLNIFSTPQGIHNLMKGNDMFKTNININKIKQIHK